jgi:nitroalkane oxidase
VLLPTVDRIDRASGAWESFLAGRDAYREIARAGFTKSFIPAGYGGAGFSMLDFAIAAEELSRVDIKVPTTLLASGLGLQPVIQHGTPEQKERFLRPFADDPEGDLLASYAFTDVAGGANFDSPDPAGGMQTLARRDGDEWVITGQKHYTTNGTGWDKKGCHLYTVVCRTDATAGADEALAVIAVPGATPDITVVDVYDKIGHRGVVTPRVHFDDVRVPAANLIGDPGQLGKRIVAGAFSWTAALIGAACVRTMRAAFEYALDSPGPRNGSAPCPSSSIRTSASCWLMAPRSARRAGGGWALSRCGGAATVGRGLGARAGGAPHGDDHWCRRGVA